MNWLQITFQADAETAEQLDEALEQIGALSVTLMDAADEPVYEPARFTTPLWGQTRIIGLFDSDADVLLIQAQLMAVMDSDILPPFQTEILADRAWTREWMADFQPMRFGERLWICPGWQAPPQPEAVNILLDPGLAFGTGTHPTTALCLTWLEAHLPDAGQRVIDYGCGSGILAIAAARLGATMVCAVDNDPQALIATCDNAQRNQVAEKIQALLPEDLPAQQVDVLIANILANPLITLAETLTTQVRHGGWIVLSGILAEQTEAVSTAYAPWVNGMTLIQRNEWVCLAGQRN